MTGWLIAEVSGGALGSLLFGTVFRVLWISFSDEFFRNRVLHALRAREKPDYANIARLERELGLALPEPPQSQMYGLSDAFESGGYYHAIIQPDNRSGSIGWKGSVVTNILSATAITRIPQKSMLTRLVPALSAKPKPEPSLDYWYAETDQDWRHKNFYDHDQDLVVYRCGDHTHSFTNEIIENNMELVNQTLLGCPKRGMVNATYPTAKKYDHTNHAV